MIDLFGDRVGFEFLNEDIIFEDAVFGFLTLCLVKT